MIPYKLLPFFIKPKKNSNEIGIKLNDNELDNLVKYAEEKGFSSQGDIDSLLFNGEVWKGERVLRIGWFVLDISRESSYPNYPDPFYVSFAQGVASKYAYYDQTEINRIHDMKPWSEIKKEKELANSKIEVEKPNSKDNFLGELKSLILDQKNEKVSKRIGKGFLYLVKG